MRSTGRHTLLQRHNLSPRMPAEPFLVLTNRLSRLPLPSRSVPQWICKSFPILLPHPSLPKTIESTNVSNFNPPHACPVSQAMALQLSPTSTPLSFSATLVSLLTLFYCFLLFRGIAYLVALVMGNFDSVSATSLSAAHNNRITTTVYTVPGKADQGLFCLDTAKRYVKIDP